MKVQENSSKFYLLIKSCWFMLFLVWLITIISNKYIVITCQNEKFIEICSFIDNNVYLTLILKFAMYYLEWILIIYAILKERLFKYKPIIISILIICFWIIKVLFSNIIIINYIDFIMIIPLIIFKPKQWLRTIFRLIITFIFTFISSIIKSVCFTEINPNNLPSIVVIIYSIDIYIMCYIYYLYSLKKGDDKNGCLVSIFQIKQKMENYKCSFRKLISSRNYNDNSICNKSNSIVEDNKSKKDRIFRLYCTIIFAIITYGSILLISYFFNRMIETTVSVIFFHIFRSKDDKTFHASNDVLCWLTSIISFTIITIVNLPLTQSILISICFAYILTTIMFYIKDYLDLRLMRNKIEKTKLVDLSLEDLIKLNSNMDESDVKIVYDYLHKKRDTSTDKFTMNNYISRRTLFRLIKKVKTNYETRLNI